MEEATPTAEGEPTTTSAIGHKKVNPMNTVQELAEADQPDSPITVSSPTVEETEEGRETEGDSNLSRSKATQTDTNSNFSQERV